VCPSTLSLPLVLIALGLASAVAGARPIEDCTGLLDGRAACKTQGVEVAAGPSLLIAQAEPSGPAAGGEDDGAARAGSESQVEGTEPSPPPKAASEPDRPPPSLGIPLPGPAAGAPADVPPAPEPTAVPKVGAPTPLPAPVPPQADTASGPTAPLQPSTADIVSIPVMQPLVEPGPADLGDKRAGGPAAGAESGRAPPSPRPDRDELLYEGLPWDFCGPRLGGSGLGGLAEPTTPRDTPVDAIADRAEYDRANERVTLQGSVEFTQGDQIVRAERSTYDRRTGEVEAEGDVYFEYPGARLTADSGHYSLQTKEGELQSVQFRLSGNANLRGTAEEATLLPADRTRYRDVTYTACPPGRSDWSLRASDLLLDHADGMGTARHARVRLGGVPVLYSPYLRFPIDDRRRTGLLIPSVGSSNTNGTELIIPFYWNIAPNYDATFYPRFMSSRGVMLGAQFRQLTRFQRLEINGEVIPNDAKSEKSTRGAIRVEQTGQLGSRWSTAVDYSSVSDDRYLADFGNRLDLTSVRNLPQRGDLRYAGDGYWWLARVQDFQTVDPTIPASSRPYAQMPHVELNLAPIRAVAPLDVRLNAFYDYFDHSAKVHGSRVVALPSVQMPLRRSYGSFIPRARIYYTGYELTDEDPGVPSQQSHLIPSLDLDGRLIFEREIDWFGSAAIQTLEPRLYYVLTSYEDQSDTPLFDTTVLDFSFASLFRPNRFTGYDRVGDENRLTVAMTSRTLGSRDGRELFRASIGQIYYFHDQQVQLRGQNVGEGPSTSSVAGELELSPAEAWTARLSLQWNPNQTEDPWEKRVLQLRYAPARKGVFNLAYRYNLGQTEAQRYEDTDLSFQLPLTSNVGLVGRWLYSWLNQETVDAVAGIEFGRCCWRLRVVGRHLKTPTQQEGSTSVMVQLELAGLGALGSSIDNLLEQGIYGYRAY